MAITSTADFLDALRAAKVLSASQLEEVVKSLAPRSPEPRPLAKELLLRGWLTAYQINQMFLGQGKDLVLGSYILLERLGEGAMGLVYKARHQAMGRTVALKVIRRQRLTHPNAIKRFHREIRALAQFSHPSMVLAYDADQVNGLHYFAMEYVEGTDLGKYVRQHGPLPIITACDYVRQVASCLQYVSERGLVHRDLKPSNLLLDHKNLTIRVLDLGLARLDEAEGEASHITQEGFIVGTADFIAPEQARNARTADIRSDLYSMGCTFYFLLTGQVPYPVKGLQQKLMKHQFEPPPPVEKLRPEVPAAVSVVIRRLMAKQPADRYQTPAELAYDLSHILTTGGLPDRSRVGRQPVRGR